MKSKGAELMREYRRVNNTSQRWVADKLGLTNQTISDYERGVHRPVRRVANAIEQEFGIPAAAWDEPVEMVEAAAS